MANEEQYEVNLERTANQPVSEGVHSFKIVDGEEGEGPKGAYWKFTCVCETEGETDKTVRMFASLSPAARWRFEIFLDAVGAPTSGKITMSKFFGKRFRAQITHEDYNGRPQANIGEMYPATTPSAVPQPSAVASGVTRRVVNAAPPPAAAKPTPVTVNPPATVASNGKGAVKTAPKTATKTVAKGKAGKVPADTQGDNIPF